MPEQTETRRASRYDAVIATLVGLCDHPAKGAIVPDISRKNLSEIGSFVTERSGV